MSVAEKVTAHLPYLRRFARAVTGSQKSGDAYVVSTLEAMLADPSIFSEDLPPRVALYRTFLKILNSIKWNNEKAGDALAPGLEAARRNLERSGPARAAGLPARLRGGVLAQDAALVMDVDESELQRLIDEAGREIARQIATDVVIIEDEPLIALDLERLVTALGHRVVKIARTERQAIEAVKRARPGLILADIQLADGSSGLDAVNEILRSFSVPVIFVTAYPQRLLTGTRPEPTFLITKPFHPDNVKAIISQALFFDIRGRPEQPRMATARGRSRQKAGARGKPSTASPRKSRLKKPWTAFQLSCRTLTRHLVPVGIAKRVEPRRTYRNICRPCRLGLHPRHVTATQGARYDGRNTTGRLVPSDAEGHLSRRKPDPGSPAEDGQERRKQRAESGAGASPRRDQGPGRAPGTGVRAARQAARGEACEAIKGLLDEGEEVMEKAKTSPAGDAGLIAAGQAVEHYEIARYGTLCAWAKQLGMTDAAKLLGETLAEEKMPTPR